MMKVIILAVLALMGQSSWAQIREFRTTRLMSTAGTGVASILSTEAAILNPAASTYFEGSSFSYQSYSTSLQNESDERKAADDDFPKNNRSQGLFMADHSGPVKGGVSYITQDENNYERSRYVLHGAAPIGDSTSLGVTYNYLQDTLPDTEDDRHQSHHQGSIGITHIVDPTTILGLVIQDWARSTPGEERLIGGFQYTLAERFTLMGDFGVQYSKNFSEDYLWRGAVQMNIFADFFLRGGQFYDNIQKLKGTGWGVGWIGPRFGVEFAQLYSEQFDSGYLYKEEKLIDTALSAIIKF